jgi:hypothetical protein
MPLSYCHGKIDTPFESNTLKMGRKIFPPLESNTLNMANKDAEFSLSLIHRPQTHRPEMLAWLGMHAMLVLWKESSHHKQPRINWLTPNVSQNHFSKRSLLCTTMHRPMRGHVA